MAPSMELYACGFNAHNQLTFGHTPEGTPKNIYRLQKILSGTSIRLLFTGWSTTVVEVDGTLRSNTGALKLPAGCSASDINSVFGDHTGVLGALTTDGDLLVCKDDDGDELIVARAESGSNPDDASLRIAHLTISGTGKICISPFPSTSSNSPSEQPLSPSTSPPTLPQYPHYLHIHPTLPFLLQPPTPLTPQTHLLPQPPTQLLSSANTFTALLPSGEIYTWGDPRHHHLGRTPTPTTPAQEPGLVTALGGIAIRKVASGGWITGAVSGEGDLYVWGGRSGSSEGGERGAGRIRCLPSPWSAAGRRKDGEEVVEGEEEGEVALVDIAGGVDVADVGVGAGHMLALTDDGRVFGVGLNSNGQVGFGEGRRFCEDWVEVPMRVGEGREVVGVECGYWSSFVLVRVV